MVVSAAKPVLELLRVRIDAPYTDFKHCISQYILFTHLSHSYVLKKDPPRQLNIKCIPTVGHILVEWSDLVETRKNIFAVTDVVESFSLCPIWILFESK